MTSTATLNVSNQLVSETILDALALVQALGLPMKAANEDKLKGYVFTRQPTVDLTVPPVLQCQGRCQWAQ